MQNDIALIKLYEDCELNCDIQPACLPNPSIINYPLEVNTTVWALGWGQTSVDETFRPTGLHEVDLKLYNGSFCDKIYENIPKDWNKQICAGKNAKNFINKNCIFYSLVFKILR